jgi:single-strand DNA-binding protein
MFQQTFIVGNLGKDPVLRHVPSGEAVTSLDVATHRTYTDPGGQTVHETTWFRVSVWGKQAEACNTYLKKGSLVLVTGRLQADPATGGPRLFTKGDGTSGTAFELTAGEVKFLVTDKDGAVTEHSLAENGQAVSDEDTVPF